jgi:hypothetical protein
MSFLPPTIKLLVPVWRILALAPLLGFFSHAHVFQIPITACQLHDATISRISGGCRRATQLFRVRPIIPITGRSCRPVEEDVLCQIDHLAQLVLHAVDG